MKNFFAVLFLIAICSSAALALKCVQCTSRQEPKCKDATGLNGTDCPELTSEQKQQGIRMVCIKAAMGNQVTVIFRNCFEHQGETDACVKLPSQVKDCTSCEKDNCNGAPPSTFGYGRDNGNRLVAWAPVLGALMVILIIFT